MADQSTELERESLTIGSWPEYNFPDNAFLVQKLTTALVVNNRRAYVLNHLGTGKTRTMLYAYDYMQQIGTCDKMLVICNISNMMKVWEDELINNFPWLKYEILYKTKEQRVKKLANKQAHIYIINHDGVETILDYLVARADIDMVCADEVAVYRNPSSNLVKYFRLLACRKPFVYGLTGQPMPRAVTDVWGPCSGITPETIPHYFSQFRAMLCYKKDLWHWAPKPGAEERAVRCMQPSVRYKLSDIVELPPQVPVYYEADLTPKQAHVYEEMRKFAVSISSEGKIDALNAGAVLSKLLQIALGYVYTRDGNVITLDNTPRLQLILDLIDSAIKKTIVFAPFKSAVAGLSAMLTANKIEHCVVTGQTPLKQRNIFFDAFQKTDQYKVLLAHPVCMSHGLTLTAASSTVWAGPVTSLDTFNQANARTYRVGQDTKTLVGMVGGTAAEKKIYKLLGQNETIQNRFLDIVEARTEGH